MTTAIMTTVPGNVWKVLVRTGDRVAQHEPLFILELMKTEVPHVAPSSGTVSAVHIAEGEIVEADVVAVEITP